MNACGGKSSVTPDSGTPPPADAASDTKDSGIDTGPIGGLTFNIGGATHGLLGAGLVLRDNGGDDLAVAADGIFKFSTKVASAAAFAVTVAHQPVTPAQICVVAAATGVATHDVTDVAVTCTTSTYAVGGTVTGVRGTGLVLINNQGDDLAVSADGSFHFSTKVASGQAFTVAVKTQPSLPTQTCSVAGASGTIGGGDVTSVTVDCSVERFAIAGTVSGLAGATVLLQNNLGNDLAITANGSFAFSTLIASGGAFAVTVKTQPRVPAQTCVVSAGAGTVSASPVDTVRVNCTTNTYSVGGTVTGLLGTGLILQNKLGNNLPITDNGAFSFMTAIASGATYRVTVMSQPGLPTQNCVVTQATGTIEDADIHDVAVSCTTAAFLVSGTVSGLAGSGLVLRNNGGNALPIGANGGFSFGVASGSTFNVTISSQPTAPNQTCTVSGGSGSVTGANVTSVTVNCATDRFALGGTVSGLLGGGFALAVNGAAGVPITANGSFAFPDTLESGMVYTVTITAQPSSPYQTCVVAAGTDTGTVMSANVTSVAITCVTNQYRVGGTVFGLAGSGLVLRNNGGDSQVINTVGAFLFAIPVASGQGYAVTVATQPSSPSQTCTLASAAGNIGNVDVSGVTVTCVTDTYAVGGTVTGLTGSVLLRDNGGDTIAVTSNAAFVFPTKVTSGAAYAVTVATQPTSPWQTCTVALGTGTVTSGPITTVAVTCVTNSYLVTGAVIGLAGSGLVLRDNGGDPFTVTQNGTFAFATALPSGTSYTVTVATQPSLPTQTCRVNGATGTVGGANVSSIVVNCATNTYTVGGAVSGLAGSGLSLLLNGASPTAVGASATFAFSTAVASGSAYAVTVGTQPTTPTQICSVASGSGTITNVNIADVAVTCVTSTYAVAVNVSGLAGSGLVVQDNGGDNLTVTGNGVTTFATAVASAAAYDITVLTQPSAPAQICTAASSGGMVGDVAVSVDITCVTTAFTVGGTLSNLASGTLILRDNGGDDLTVSADGTFTFATSLTVGSAYSVAVVSSTVPIPCFVTSGNGTVGSGNVTDVSISCSATPGPTPITTSFTETLASVVMTITWDGTSYWTTTGGGPDGVRFANYDASGTPIATYSPGIDFRSAFTINGRGSAVYARGFNTRTVRLQTAPGVFEAATITLAGTAPNAQSSVVWNEIGTELIALSAGTVQRWASDGSALPNLTLTGYGTQAGEGGTAGRGIVKAGGFYLTIANGAVSTWDTAGVRQTTAALTGAPTGGNFAYSWSYAHGMVWLYNSISDKWQGWDIGL